jgi:glycosyltransferase involved in cell wall biosynthesis
VVQSLAVQNGGTSISVPALASATGQTGRYANSLLHFTSNNAAPAGECSFLRLLHHSCHGLDLMFPTGARAFLRKAVDQTDVLQVHGIWTAHSAATMDFAAKFRKPVIVSAHGMLDGWALRHKRWKKLPYAALVERPKLTRATCLRALTRVEAENYRAFGLKLPIAIIPNGVVAVDTVSSSQFLDLYPHLRGKKILLFLGRLHKKKGVDLLVKAWKIVSTQVRNSHLVLAGPDDGALDVVDLSEPSITKCGLLTGSMKWSALSAASAFVLPSFSEGLSMAILEALWMRLPVLITRQCNFREIEKLECTFLTEPSVASIANGLVDILSRPADELRNRGDTGSTFVRANYGWPLIGRKMADVYDWMRGGPVPSSVEIIR